MSKKTHTEIGKQQTQTAPINSFLSLQSTKTHKNSKHQGYGVNLWFLVRRKNMLLTTSRSERNRNAVKPTLVTTSLKQ
jgi:hypothetical protein